MLTHGGNLRALAEKFNLESHEIIDFSANINVLGFPSWVRPLINREVGRVIHYPDWDYKNLITGLEKYTGRKKSEISLGNGISEILYLLPLALDFEKAIIPNPTFSEYEKVCRLHNKEVISFELKEEEHFSLHCSSIEREIEKNKENKLAVFLCHPNNPTGMGLDFDALKNCIKKYPRVDFIIDEAFIYFSDLKSFSSLVEENVILLYSLTKVLALPGLRFGYCLSSEKICKKIKSFLPPWNINIFSDSIVSEFFKNEKCFLAKTVEENKNLKKDFLKNLTTIKELKVFTSFSNFFLIRLLKGEAKKLSEFVLAHYKIAIREANNFKGLEEGEYIRLAIKKKEENQILIGALRDFYHYKKLRMKKKTPAIMMQGTSSNAGKSIMATALCRIFFQDGLKVAPFKSQNMALNSFVTKGYGEIGRAQALQAQASKLDPHIHMNPILLKPNSDTGSQVIINGIPLKHMQFSDYFKYKPKAFEEVKKAYDSLSSEMDVMVIEGAGSPSEVNLKKNDIVNMNMAKYAKADVYLVGDIDRGGLFASFMGTFDTLEEWERKLVKGMIINRFRGCKDLLVPGVDYLEKYLKIPVSGLVPHIKSLNLPEEDCIEFKSGLLDDKKPLGKRIDIAVIDTPRISNFSDIDPFREEPDVRIRVVRSLKDLEIPDALLLLGSKSVVNDLSYLKESGLFTGIKQLNQVHNIPLVGICGGLQMLGKKIRDPLFIESNKLSEDGFGFLDIETTLEKEKFLSQTTAYFLEKEQVVNGYEIHHGKTTILDKTKIKAIIKNKEGKTIGFSNDDQSVWGSYLHGIFDNDLFRRSFINKLRILKNLNPINEILAPYNIEKDLDRLASIVRKSLDMDQIYKNLGL